MDPNLTDAVNECISDARLVVAGSRYIRDYCRRFNNKVEVVWTGSPLPGQTVSFEQATERGKILAWAVSDAAAYSGERQLIIRILEALIAVRGGTDFEFWCFGVRNTNGISDLLALSRQRGLLIKTFPFMPYGDFLRHLKSVAVGLCPFVLENEFSNGKSFGKNLGYLSQSVACVVSNNVDHPRFFIQGENGFLANSVSEYVDAISLLFDDPMLRAKIALKGYMDYVQRLTTLSSAQILDAHIRKYSSF
ncbi:hypothetical protein SH467x_004163 [Pirellulaceae bacterium SH467]